MEILHTIASFLLPFSMLFGWGVTPPEASGGVSFGGGGATLSGGLFDVSGTVVTPKDSRTITSPVFAGSSSSASSTFAGGVEVSSRGYGFADGTYQTTAAVPGLTSLTPWTENIDGGGYSLSGVLDFTATGTSTQATTTADSLVVNDLTASYAVVTNAVKKLVSLVYTPSASSLSIVSRDANGSAGFTNAFIAVTSTVTSGQIIVMTYGSAGKQVSTGTAAIQYNLPDATYLIAGADYRFDNDSTGTMSIYLNDGTTPLTTVPYGGYMIVQLTNNSTTNGAWTFNATLATLATSGTSGTYLPGVISSTGLSITNATSTGKLNIPNGASPSVVTTGDIAIDTTSDQLIGYGASSKKVYGNGFTEFGFTYPAVATSTWMSATTSIPVGFAMSAQEWNSARCKTDAGTLQVSVNDGTNRMNFINASTTPDLNVLSVNNTFTAGETRFIDIGTPASSPTQVTCSFTKSLTAD